MSKRPTTRRLMREAMDGPDEPCEVDVKALSVFVTRHCEFKLVPGRSAAGADLAIPRSRLDVAVDLLWMLGQLCSAEAIGAAVLGYLHKYDDCVDPRMAREMRRQLAPDWSWSHEETEARARFYEGQMKALAAECDRLRAKLAEAS